MASHPPDSSSPTARFITFEGIEGSGKTTQVDRLAARLRQAGVEPLVTREPGGTPLGVGLRGLLLAPSETPMSAAAELLLYAADRAQHLQDVVLPALRRGRVVLCDRYLDATLAYQGYGRELGSEWILAIHRHRSLWRPPDRTILLDLDPARALERAKARNRRQGLERTEGRFEAERIDFHARVREGYRSIAASEPDRVCLLEAAGSEEEIASEIRRALAPLLPALGVGR